MDNQGHDHFDLRTSTSQQIEQVMNQGVIAALREHKRAGNPVVTWDRENDRVMLVPPEQIIVPDEDEATIEAVTIEDQS